MAHTSPFHDLHMNRSATMVEYDGYQVPAHYGDPVAEALAPMQGLAVVDMTHRYRIRVAGEQAVALLDRLVTAKVTRLWENRQCHTLLCNEDGSVWEELWLRRLENGIICAGNGVNRERVLNLLKESAAGMAVKITDESFKTAMVSLLGAEALGILHDKLPIELNAREPDDVHSLTMLFMRLTLSVNSADCIPGVSLILPSQMAGMAWEMLEKYGQRYQIQPAGLAAREHWRIGAARPAVGREIDGKSDPFALGWGDRVALDKEFIGAESLRTLAANAPQSRLQKIKLAETEPITLPLPVATEQGAQGALTSVSQLDSQAMGLVFMNQPLASDTSTTLHTTDGTLVGQTI